jgi:hypothetical protein
MTVKKPPPLLGYNTNVRHGGKLFHIQTEDSGIDHPHVITHLFVDGTILATKKKSYADSLDQEHWENTVRALMKDQHRAMFIELRDGTHDQTARAIFGDDSDFKTGISPIDAVEVADVDLSTDVSESLASMSGATPQKDPVRVIRPAEMTAKKSAEEKAHGAPYRGRSIFDSPENNGEFGENLITDKSLDEVILSYLTDELEE